MPPASHDASWPDKAMFAAMLLVLGGLVGATLELTRGWMEVDQERLPTLFSDDIPFYTLGLCLAVLALGVVSLRRQAAVPAYLGSMLGVASLGAFGLVSVLSLVAAAFMVKSRLEGEETRLDGVQLHGLHWPDKALAASLLIVVVATVAATQGLLILARRFDPILLQGAGWAGAFGVAAGLFGLFAAREVYLLRRPWLGWTSLFLGLATLGFYLIGPLIAVAGMVLLWLAHREDEFSIGAPGARATA